MKLSLTELAALRVAVKRNDDSKLSEKLKRQFKKGLRKEVRVQLLYTEVNDYQELWKVVGEEKYYSRYTYGLPKWYSVCDPLGYAELNQTLPEDIIFIVCDDEGNELFGLSNLEGAILPTLEEMCIIEWNRIKAEYPHCKDNKESDFWMQAFGQGTTIGADTWLLTFKDPEIYGDAAKDYDENWVFHKEIIKEEPISDFTYLGTKYGIWKITYQHRDCKKEVIEYWVAKFAEGCNTKIAEYGLIQFLDSYFEGEPGTMYIKRDAIAKVKEALEKIYNSEPISFIYSTLGYAYERFIGYKDAAEKLLNGNWNRQFVEELIKKEAEKHTFFIREDTAIDELYPDCQRDHAWNYDFMGRRIV